MPRNQRCVMPGEAYHITQRGTNRQRVFFKDADRSTYLRLMAHNLADAGVRVLAWCLMGNHIHIVAVAEHNDSLSVLLRRVHGRYAQMVNARQFAHTVIHSVAPWCARRKGPQNSGKSSGNAGGLSPRIRGRSGTTALVIV
jgi:REP element-mobilizing transposase RayT